MARYAAGCTALLLAVVGVWQSTSAAFNTSTLTSNNALTAGTVAVTDDDGGSALFTATGLQRGSTGTRCVTVTYSGSLAAQVRMYASSSSGTLGSSLDITIEEGAGGSFANCSGFSASGGTIFSGTLSTFTTDETNWATGVGSWAPAGGSGATRTYRITYTLSASAPESASNATASAVLVWEAQSA